MPKNLLFLTDRLPKPNYEVVASKRNNQSFQNQAVSPNHLPELKTKGKGSTNRRPEKDIIREKLEGNLESKVENRDGKIESRADKGDHSGNNDILSNNHSKSPPLGMGIGKKSISPKSPKSRNPSQINPSNDDIETLKKKLKIENERESSVNPINNNNIRVIKPTMSSNTNINNINNSINNSINNNNINNNNHHNNEKSVLPNIKVVSNILNEDRGRNNSRASSPKNK